MLTSIPKIEKKFNPIDKQTEYIDNYKYIPDMCSPYEILDIVKIIFINISHCLNFKFKIIYIKLGCYLDNSDKYHKIEVVDPDEIILPRTKFPLIKTSRESIEFTLSINKKNDLLNRESVCSNDTNDNNKTDIQLFLEDIENKYNLYNSTIGFTMISYWRYITFETLMEKVESLIESLNLDTNGRENFKETTIIISSPKSRKFKDDLEYWEITINGVKELKYAEGLLFLYKNYVKPFMDELNYEIKDPEDIYYRFFYLMSNF
jgi:hypothetical protein